ncbi:MAG: DUF4037 domain-containing protein [Clostridia bacterium]|nr:DUF4037 domain-containing protein [Clostridia bacterium]
MKGLELAEKYYRAFGESMIREQFPEWEGQIAAGLTGSGSECYGYDDGISADHDFEPGFCLFLPGEEQLDRKAAFQLERAYAKLPAEFEGYTRQKMAPTGGQRHGVFRREEYFREKLGCLPEEMTAQDWLRLPDWALAEAVNGKIFRDDAGEMTRAREILRNMPEDIRRKRLAGHLLMMAQSGQYNYSRCLKHGETGAAQLAAGTFVDHAMAAAFLLEGKCRPYYKWSFRALKELPGGEDLARSLEWLLTTGNGPEIAEDKYFCMEGIASDVIEKLQEQEMTQAICGDLEKHAYSVNDGIRDAVVRNLNVMVCV